MIFNIFPIFERERERELKTQKKKKKTKQNKTKQTNKTKAFCLRTLDIVFVRIYVLSWSWSGQILQSLFLNHNLAIFFLIQTKHFQTVPHNRNKFNPLVGFYNHVFVCDTYHYQLYIANIIRKRKNKKCVSSNGKWLLCYFVMSIFSKKDKETKISSSERVKKKKEKKKSHA